MLTDSGEAPVVEDTQKQKKLSWGWMTSQGELFLFFDDH